MGDRVVDQMILASRSFENNGPLLGGLKVRCFAVAITLSALVGVNALVSFISAFPAGFRSLSEIMTLQPMFVSHVSLDRYHSNDDDDDDYDEMMRTSLQHEYW